MKLPRLWQPHQVSVYDFFYLNFLLALTLAVSFYPDYPLTASALAHLPLFNAQTYVLVTCICLLALAWRRWIPPVKLALLSSMLLYTLVVIVFALPAAGRLSDFIVAAVVIGWSYLFIRGGGG